MSVKGKAGFEPAALKPDPPSKPVGSPPMKTAKTGEGRGTDRGIEAQYHLLELLIRVEPTQRGIGLASNE